MQNFIFSPLDHQALIDAISEQVTTKILSVVCKQNESSFNKEDRLTRKQAASYLNVTLPTLDRYKNEGRIPFYQTGRTIYFKKSKIDEALAVNLNKKGGKHV